MPLHPAVHAARLRRVPASSASPLASRSARRPFEWPAAIFTKIADIGSDLMKIVFKIKEDDAAQSWCDRRLHRRQCRRFRWARAPTVSRPTESPALRLSRSSCSLVSSPPGTSAVARVDLHHAHHDGGLLRHLPTSSTRPIAKARYATLGESSTTNRRSRFLVWLTSIISIVLTFRRILLHRSRFWEATHLAVVEALDGDHPAERWPGRPDTGNW